MNPDLFLSGVIKQFEYYKHLGEGAMHQLNEPQLFHVTHEESNSIAIIVNHLHGNMKSRWTDFFVHRWRKELEEP